MRLNRKESYLKSHKEVDRAVLLKLRPLELGCAVW